MKFKESEKTPNTMESSRSPKQKIDSIEESSTESAEDEKGLFYDEITDFLSYCRVEKGLAVNTIESYRFDLKHLVLFCSEKGLINIERLTMADLLEYINWLNTVKGLTGASVKRHRVSMRRFFKYLTDESGRLSVNPAELIEGPHSDVPLPTVITTEQVDLLLSLPHRAIKIKGSKISPSKKSQYLRDAAMLELMYGTGIRVSELIELKKEHWKEDFIEVVGKGDKERIIPVHQGIKRLIREYWETLTGVHSPYVFLSTHKKPMTRQNFWMIIKKYGKQAGIHGKFSPHCLRHAFATHMLMQDVNLRHLQAMLGHSDIRTTEIYTYVASKQLKIAHQKYHPRGISSI